MALHIDMLFSTKDPVINPIGNLTPQREQDRKVFCQRLLQSLSDILSGRAIEMSFIEKVKNIKVAYDLSPEGLCEAIQHPTYLF